MRTESINQVSEALLAHLHLSHSQAAVMVDDLRNPTKLVVHIYDPNAALKVKNVSTWKGLAVRYIREIIQPHR